MISIVEIEDALSDHDPEWALRKMKEGKIIRIGAAQARLKIKDGWLHVRAHRYENWRDMKTLPGEWGLLNCPDVRFDVCDDF